MPLGPCERERTGTLRPDRIGQDVEPSHLNQECRVADQADAQIVRTNLGWRGVLEGTWVGHGPGHLSLGQLPAQEVAKATRAVLAGIEKALSIEVIAQRA